MTDKRSSCKELECPSLYDACLWRGDGDRPAHLIIVNSFPSAFSVGQNQPFCGHQGRLFKNILKFIREFQGGRYANLQVYYTYSVLTALPAGAHDPPRKMLDACHSNLMRDITAIRGAAGRLPVIVPLGPVAARAVGLKFKSVYDVAGRVLSLSLNTPQGAQQYKVVPLMSMKDMQANPGKVNVEVAALLKATKLAMEGDVDVKQDLSILTKDYVYPKTIEEVRELVDHIIDYHDPESGVDPTSWLIGVDTETNTLFPHKEGAKVLMLSVAWDDKKAATILLNHDECPYDPVEAWKEVRRLLACSKPKVLHNDKFDLKFLERVHDAELCRVVWDTLLGEHYLDEDKKGLYSLKKLTTIYTPAYEGYDEELQRVLRASDTLDEDGRDTKGHFFITDDDIVERVQTGDAPAWLEEEAWIALGHNLKKYNEAMQKKVPDWVNPALSQKVTALLKTKEELRVDKKPLGDIRAQISKLRKALRDDVMIVRSELRENNREAKKTLKIKKPTANTPEKGGKRGGGFESIPLEQILQYAGVDADVTRRIAKQQIQRIQATGLGAEGHSVMRTLYLAATPVLADMEFHGVKVDNDYLSYIETEITVLLETVTLELKAKFDPTINFGSPPQVAALMQKMNFPALPGIEAGSTKNEALEKYRKMYPDTDLRHVLADKLIEYRAADKALGGFLVNLRRLSRMDGRIHCQFHLNGTSTGRLCVSGDTPLNTSHGIFSISELDLQKNQLSIMTHEGRMRRILHKYYKGSERMLHVRLDDDNSIMCTNGHHLLTPKGWQHADELTTGSKICGPKDERCAEYPERTVVAIEDAGVRDVWDIEVEEDHSYVAQGMIHHNSSSAPNMQNIPKIMCRLTKTEIDANGGEREVVVHPGYNIKKVFIPSKPGFKIVNMDIKGAELRVYTVYSKDQRMIDAICNGDDIHSITCAQIYKIPYEEVLRRKESDPDIIDKRTRAKRVIFGTFYGAGPWKISQQINSTVEEAEKIQEGLFNAFPALRAYVDGVKHMVRQRQFVKTVFGRCRRFRLAHLGGSYYSSACREAVNFLIQSTASDLLLSQMCEMSDAVKTELGGQMLITVHDSVVLELPEENVSKLKGFFDHYVTDRVAEKYKWLPVPFLYDYEVGDNYGEVYAEKEFD